MKNAYFVWIVFFAFGVISQITSANQSNTSTSAKKNSVRLPLFQLPHELRPGFIVWKAIVVDEVLLPPPPLAVVEKAL